MYSISITLTQMYNNKVHSRLYQSGKYQIWSGSTAQCVLDIMAIITVCLALECFHWDCYQNQFESMWFHHFAHYSWIVKLIAIKVVFVYVSIEVFHTSNRNFLCRILRAELLKVNLNRSVYLALNLKCAPTKSPGSFFSYSIFIGIKSHEILFHCHVVDNSDRKNARISIIIITIKITLLRFLQAIII